MMQTITPEVLWHGGGNENGKPDPVYALDIHPSNVLATAGIDASVPPKGSVRLWKINVEMDTQEFLIDLCDHQSVVNVVRFSPCGHMLACASERQIVVYKVANPSIWGTLTEMKDVERIWLRPVLGEMYDLTWSPDSEYVLAGSLDTKAEIIRIATRESLLLPGHMSYVQGVAWDPRNQYVVTQSADRSLKFHVTKQKPNTMLKMAPRGHSTIKMLANVSVPGSDKNPLTAADFGMTEDGQFDKQKSRNLFGDSSVPSFFRRPQFSPDGSILVAPTGIYRPQPTPDGRETGPMSFCTHIFSRGQLAKGNPVASLVGLEEPSVSVRFSPIVYKPLIHDPSSKPNMMIPGKYRFVFAVTTISAVFVYDTQHHHPIARIGGLHFACINDATWSADGQMLTVCSSDGYVSFIKFPPQSLGEALTADEVPDFMKTAFPSIYKPAQDVNKMTLQELNALQASRKENNANLAEATKSPSKKSADGVAGATPTSRKDTSCVDKKRKRIVPMMLSSTPGKSDGSADGDSSDFREAVLQSPLLSPHPNLQTAQACDTSTMSMEKSNSNVLTDLTDSAKKRSHEEIADAGVHASTTEKMEVKPSESVLNKEMLQAAVAVSAATTSKPKKRITTTLVSSTAIKPASSSSSSS